MKKFLFTLTMAAALSGMQANAGTNDYLTGKAGQTAKVGETLQLELQLASGSDVVAGYQADITVTNASDVTFGEGFAASGDVLEGGWYGSNQLADGTFKILSYSESCSTLAKQTTARTVSTIPVTFAKEGTYTFTVKNVILSDETGTTITAANKTFTVTVEAEEEWPSMALLDFNEDGEFDFFDILDLLDCYNEGDYESMVDFNEDGECDFFDILDMLDYYNETR